MTWTLVISEEEDFHREAIALIGLDRPIVGATGDAAACGLVHALAPERILVDGDGDLGRRFLRAIAGLPARARPPIVVIGPPQRAPLFITVSSLRAALATRAA